MYRATTTVQIEAENQKTHLLLVVHEQNIKLPGSTITANCKTPLIASLLYMLCIYIKSVTQEAPSMTDITPLSLSLMSTQNIIVSQKHQHCPVYIHTHICSTPTG